MGLIVSIVGIAKYGSPGLVIPTEYPGQENLEGQQPQMNPQTGQMVPPCMDIRPMEGWCLENSELCTQRIEECHDLMSANTASVGTGNALLVFLIIAVLVIIAGTVMEIKAGVDDEDDGDGYEDDTRAFNNGRAEATDYGLNGTGYSQGKHSMTHND